MLKEFESDQGEPAANADEGQSAAGEAAALLQQKFIKDMLAKIDAADNPIAAAAVVVAADAPPVATVTVAASPSSSTSVTVSNPVVPNASPRSC